MSASLRVCLPVCLYAFMTVMPVCGNVCSLPFPRSLSLDRYSSFSTCNLPSQDRLVFE